MQVEESGVFERIFSPFQRPVDPDEKCKDMILLGYCTRAPIVDMYLLVDEECSDRSQIVKNMIILGDLGDNLAKEVSVPPNKWAHPCTPGFSRWCKVQIQPRRKRLKVGQK